MKPAKVAAIVGGVVVTAVVFFAVGRLTRPREDWSRQHTNRSSDPKEFRNAFLGLTVRAPEGADWQLVCERDKLRRMAGAQVNKVLEINRLLERGGSDRQWARMALFVEPLFGGVPLEQVLRRLEFRGRRSGFRVVGTEKITVGGKPGKARLGAWAVKHKKYRTINYHVEHRDRLYSFIGVTEADAFDRFRPIFDQVIATVRLD